MSFRVERDSVADRELEHPGMGPGLLQEAQPLDDPMVQVDQRCF